ncbi:TPA: hypothetical protein DCP77_00865 [Candidatus Collierbacteria bacterium]|uniref:Antitoxin n=1 Tax=Candidatus Collierbacteria bacterium GW2011_GWA2_42_17 TaxID=1618378 RepID=A0A0G1B976_9BACT|nr:MAG: hypothetical protein UU94_C0002G0018 [Candidatus Collierbacteria bacterium GW2011_GWB2_42_12]KKS42876.1 MAG: hypothetical protein UV06_C0004G0011 [Candidatus Collierbacteria bacterium GW2011_GWA2_42_17]KKS62986.1 MAG: hypothetical protein UV28_C0002G0009 [Candidatus Collierbacteria bacterium GW2011_GWE2_42_48]KKS63276.1 MAG: hypothetical protein UV29_C0004G0033 [Candidatus Collierbacteria bacterium GW2011_GWD2_42_50]KKS63318.1 MAG: hypothetical protein UV30_C0004G0031 [Candidatus Collie
MQLINATEARKNFFSILDEVYFDGKEVMIKKGNRVKVKFTPVTAEKAFDYTKYRNDLKKVDGIFDEHDFSDMQKAKMSMDKNVKNW